METSSRTETKKALCRSFVNVVIKSPLNGAIDPKAFLLMLNTQFAVLYRNGRINLGPLWDAMANDDLNPEQLCGLFLRFQDAAQKLGLTVALPESIAALSAADRQMTLLRFLGDTAPEHLGDPSGFTPLVEFEPSTPHLPIEAIRVGLPAPINVEPVPLDTGDIKPLISEEQKRRINQSVVQAFRSTPIALRTDGAKIAFWCDQHFDGVCDGLRFHFAPLVGVARELGKDVTDLDLAVTAHRLQELLHVHGIMLEIPPLQVEPHELSTAIAEAATRRIANATSDPRLPAITLPRAISRSEAPAEAPGGHAHANAPHEGEHKTEHKGEHKAEKLAKWGLEGRHDSKLVRYVRPAALAFVLLVLCLFTWLNRGSRPLEVDLYNTVFPIRAARLEEGAFQGTIDVARWKKLTYKQRQEAVAHLETILKEQGMIPNLQIRDPDNRVVIVGAGAGKIAASPFLMRLELPPGDTTAPPEEKPVTGKAIGQKLPAPSPAPQN